MKIVKAIPTTRDLQGVIYIYYEDGTELLRPLTEVIDEWIYLQNSAASRISPKLPDFNPNDYDYGLV